MKNHEKSNFLFVWKFEKKMGEFIESGTQKYKYQR